MPDVITASEWSITHEGKKKKILIFQFWRPHGHISDPPKEIELLPPSESRRYPGVMFYGHKMIIAKWGFSPERDTYFVWPCFKGPPVVVAEMKRVYSGGTIPYDEQKRITATMFRKCLRRVPKDQFPEESKRRLLRWPIQAIEVRSKTIEGE